MEKKTLLGVAMIDAIAFLLRQELQREAQSSRKRIQITDLLMQMMKASELPPSESGTGITCESTGKGNGDDDVPPAQVGSDSDGGVEAARILAESSSGVLEVPTVRGSVPGGLAQHQCPDCGAVHNVKRYSGSTEKMAAYRKRKN